MHAGSHRHPSCIKAAAVWAVGSLESLPGARCPQYSTGPTQYIVNTVHCLCIDMSAGSFESLPGARWFSGACSGRDCVLVDAAVALAAAVFVGNPTSSFSLNVARMRQVRRGGGRIQGGTDRQTDPDKVSKKRIGR